MFWYLTRMSSFKKIIKGKKKKNKKKQTTATVVTNKQLQTNKCNCDSLGVQVIPIKPLLLDGFNKKMGC